MGSLKDMLGLHRLIRHIDSKGEVVDLATKANMVQIQLELLNNLNAALVDISKQLKIINIHMATITGDELDMWEVDG